MKRNYTVYTDDNNLVNTRQASNRQLLSRIRKEVQKETADRLADLYSNNDLQQSDTTIVTADEATIDAAHTSNLKSEIKYITQNGDTGAYYTQSNVDDASIYNPKRWANRQYNDGVYNALLNREYTFDQSQQTMPNPPFYASNPVTENIDKRDSDITKRSDQKTELDNKDGRKRVMVVKKNSQSSISAAEHVPETFIKSSYDDFESPSFHGFNLNSDGERYIDPWSQRTFWLLLIILIMNSGVILFCIYGQTVEKYKQGKRREKKRKHVLHSASFGSRQKKIKIASDSDVDDATEDELVE